MGSLTDTAKFILVLVALFVLIVAIIAIGWYLNTLPVKISDATVVTKWEVHKLAWQQHFWWHIVFLSLCFTPLVAILLGRMFKGKS